ncbi:hypothetical protein COLO4_21360 [Corchorus olitorius]|uniref:Uncharacterized protein n=1 Tax=Corchorus olitorius TaxID=93759 RepID=A0A1R3ITQ5_9ROSI|nr:hypothetical protein COLO4_21360 [Corchorus olitorius]
MMVFKGALALNERVDERDKLGAGMSWTMVEMTC